MGRRMGHSSRMSKAAPDAAGQVFRLTDMDVEEVSLVDRAANKKKFLVVKRDGDQMATEVQPNGKGGFSTAAKPNVTATTKAGMEVPPGFKEAVAPIFDKAVAAMEALQEQVASSTPADVPDDGSMPGVPAEFANGVTTVMNLLDRAQNMWPQAAPDPEDAPPPEGDGGADEATEDATTAMSMRLALDNVGKAFSKKRLNKALVQKIGAKMSKDRLTRLQQAVAQLSNLVNEVAGAQPSAPTGTPPVGKTAKNESNAALDALSTQIDQLATSFAKVAQVVASDHKVIEAISKSRGAPAGGPVEGVTPTKKSERVSWPLDINEPITRDTVGKSDSFFDNE